VPFIDDIGMDSMGKIDYAVTIKFLDIEGTWQ